MEKKDRADWRHELALTFSEDDLDAESKHTSHKVSVPIASMEEIDTSFALMAERIFEAGMLALGRVEPTGRVLWSCLREALEREPTHRESNLFIAAMRKVGWVSENFHVHKVRYLQSQIENTNAAAKETHNENLDLRSLIDEHQAMIEKLRAKLVEQDTVIGQIARRSSFRGN